MYETPYKENCPGKYKIMIDRLEKSIHEMLYTKYFLSRLILNMGVGVRLFIYPIITNYNGKKTM